MLKTFTKKVFSFSLILFLLIIIIFTTGMVVSAAESTGVGLSEHCMTAYEEKWEYVWGGASEGAVDCSGLIVLYNNVGGIRFDLMAMSPETGPISTLPNIHGLGLFQPGHVGVYVGSGMAVDARSSADDMCYQSVYSKDWTNWFKIYGVTYPEEGWVMYKNNYFYYEDSEYIVNTKRTFNKITYTFASSGICVSAIDSKGNPIAINDAINEIIIEAFKIEDISTSSSVSYQTNKKPPVSSIISTVSVPETTQSETEFLIFIKNMLDKLVNGGV